jgi:hypothetical protein
MSRYQFTDAGGFVAGPVVEARTATEAAGKVRGLTGRGDLRCAHLSDDHSGGVDAILYYGPDAIER